jgi:hypothetical protein
VKAAATSTAARTIRAPQGDYRQHEHDGRDERPAPLDHCLDKLPGIGWQARIPPHDRNRVADAETIAANNRQQERRGEQECGASNPRQLGGGRLHIVLLDAAPVDSNGKDAGQRD